VDWIGSGKWTYVRLWDTFNAYSNRNLMPLCYFSLNDVIWLDVFGNVWLLTTLKLCKPIICW